MIITSTIYSTLNYFDLMHTSSKLWSNVVWMAKLYIDNILTFLT